MAERHAVNASTGKHTMVTRFLSLAALSAACCGSPALAVTFEGAVTQGGTVVTPYVDTGLISFDIDFANALPTTMTFIIDEQDLMPGVALNAMLRNFTGSGLAGYAFTLDKGAFGTVGSVIRGFGGGTTISTTGGSATLRFDSPEYLDVEVGNALGVTAGASDWALTGLHAGDRLELVVSVVPEPGSVAMLLAGLLAVGSLVRRRLH